jgi:hypothetical protein
MNSLARWTLMEPPANLWETVVTHWRDTLMDRPRADGEVYATGWTISGLATLATILAVWVFVI